MRKSVLSFLAAALILMACNNEAGNKETAANSPAANEPATADTPKAAPAPDPAPAPTPAPATTAAWKGVQEVSDAVFAQKVLNNPGLTIVDFNATWCGPCKTLKPIFDKAADDFSGKASFASIDTDENPTVTQQYKVQSIPLLLFFKNGKVVKSIVGLVGAKELHDTVAKNL